LRILYPTDCEINEPELLLTVRSHLPFLDPPKIPEVTGSRRWTRNYYTTGSNLFSGASIYTQIWKHGMLVSLR